MHPLLDMGRLIQGFLQPQEMEVTETMISYTINDKYSRDSGLHINGVFYSFFLLHTIGELSKTDRIQTIKVTRAFTGLGLKEAKNVCDVAMMLTFDRE
jgi:hypothetical protein